MARLIDLVGKQFSKLTVVELLEERGKNNKRQWLCACSCGNTVVVTTESLNSSHTKSCGCILIERLKERSTHNMTKTKEYKAWQNIKRRCYEESNISYPRYGAKGIEFDYKDDFLGFLEEVGHVPSDSARWSIDRIDNSKGYIKNNMRWATDENQARNKSKMKNNTSGTTGVKWDLKRCKHYEPTKYAVAYWNDINGKQKCKAFSVKKYGEDGAFAMACAYRDKMIAELNAQGAGYSENHGK